MFDGMKLHRKRRRKIFKFTALLFAAFLFISQTVKAENPPNQAWVMRYDNGGTDAAFAFTADSLGNSYITGTSFSGIDSYGRLNYDFATIKYNSAGNQLWVRRYDSGGINDQGRAIAVDNSGNVYIAGPGFFSPECTTIKYDTNGNRLWTMRYGNATVARDVITDNAGNVYTLCFEHNRGVHYIVKYGPVGTQLWVNEFTTGSSYEDIFTNRQLRSLFVDTNGNIYSTTNNFNGVNHDYITVKYDVNGNKLWERSYDGGSFDSSRAIVVDNSGNVYVTGQSFDGSGSTNIDYVTVKYDLNGNQSWIKRFDSGGDDRAIDILVDDFENVYITGSDSGGLGRITTVKYDLNGNQLRAYTSDNTRVIAILNDVSGFYVLGNNSVTKYNFNVEQLWSIQMTISWIANFRVDGAVNIYTGGYDCVVNCDYVVSKYIPSSLPSQFWSEAQNVLNWIRLRQTPGVTGKSASDVVKTLPNKWVVKVINVKDANGNDVDLDDYRWYQVQDVTDGATGWIAAQSLSDGTIYLGHNPSKQVELESKAAIQLTTTDQRKPVILNAVDAYYISPNTEDSLYGGGGGRYGNNNFQRFIQGANFPKEAILAVIAEESGSSGHNLNNEICSDERDGGMGIMQITTTDFKGLGSGLDNFSHKNDCRSQTEFLSKYYSNALQGIYANIKDGFRTFQEKYKTRCPSEDRLIEGLIFTCQDREKILTIKAYHGIHDGYVGRVAARLENLDTYFAGITYANTDQLIEKLILANSNNIIARLYSPATLRVIDSEGNVTGVADNTIREDIFTSTYDPKFEEVAIFFPADSYRYQVIGKTEGVYGLDINNTDDPFIAQFRARNIPIKPNEIHQYTVLDWNKVAACERGGVVLEIDLEGDGIFDKSILVDCELLDIEPPEIIVSPFQEEYLLNSNIQISFNATDNLSGIASISATINGNDVLSGQTAILNQPGTNILRIIAADNEGNESVLEKNFTVIYNFGGFLPPIKKDGSGIYNQGRTLPVKLELRDANNNLISTAIAKLFVAKISDGGIIGTDEIPLSTSNADTGNEFRYDGDVYIYNLSMDTLSVGSWQLKAVLDDGKYYTVLISIR